MIRHLDQNRAFPGTVVYALGFQFGVDVILPSFVSNGIIKNEHPANYIQ